jgi:hypothetical protein
MSHKPVTTAQLEQVRKMAKEKGIHLPLFQQALDNGSVGRFLDSIKADEATEYVPLSDARIEELTALATKVGARIHVLRRVRVKHNREWQEAVNLAGPNTPDHYNVRKSEVSGQYQPTSNKEIETDIVLLNYSKGDGNWDKGTAWGKEARLNATNPREVFAIGEQKPDLHTILGQNPMYAVAPTECTFGGGRSACYVWWYGCLREAALPWVSNFRGARAWFAFRE